MRQKHRHKVRKDLRILQAAARYVEIDESIAETFLGVMQHSSHVFLVVMALVELLHGSAPIRMKNVSF